MALTVDAAEFDGSTYLNRGSDLTGNADSSVGSLSLFLDIGAVDGNFNAIMENDGGYVRVRRNSSDKLSIELASPSAASILVFTSSSSVVDLTGIVSFLASWDMNFGAGLKLSQLYVNDASDITVVTDTGVADVVNYTTTDWSVGASPAGSIPLTGCLSELWFTNEYIDFSVEANRRKFITAAFKPQDLGADGSTPTGTAPLIYLHLDDAEAAANFALNAGTGGDFTITGTLTTCATSPSDGAAATGNPYYAYAQQ